MKHSRNVVVNALVGGLLVLLPIYLAVLLLFKAIKVAIDLLAPITALLPDWVPAKNLWSVLAMLVLCLLVGAAVRTRKGRAIRERVEQRLFGDFPGYALFRSFTQRLAGRGEADVWKPVLAEIEDALVPAFIIEELADGRLTVFVPSVPTVFAGAVYILNKERVHPTDVPFTHAIRTISRWGAGSGRRGSDEVVA